MDMMDDGMTSEAILMEAMSKGGTIRNSRQYSEMMDPNYMKMVEKTTQFFIYRQKLMELVLSTFRWNNLPDSMNGRYLEMSLHRYGRAVVTKHKDEGTLCNFRLGGHRGKLDIYGEPKIYEVLGFEYYDNVDVSKAVIMYNNRMKLPTFKVVNQIAFELAEADLVISQNLNAQSNPVLITGPESKKKDLMNVYRMRNNFIPTIVGDKALKEDVEIKVLQTNVPFIVDKVNTHKHVVWNRGMTFLGVDNANQEKRERMITGEIEANVDQVNLFRESMLSERANAADKINEMFGTNIIVEYNDGPINQLAEMMTNTRVDLMNSEINLNNTEAELKRSQSVNQEIEDVAGETEGLSE